MSIQSSNLYPQGERSNNAQRPLFFSHRKRGLGRAEASHPGDSPKQSPGPCSPATVRRPGMNCGTPGSRSVGEVYPGRCTTRVYREVYTHQGIPGTYTGRCTPTRIPGYHSRRCTPTRIPGYHSRKRGIYHPGTIAGREVYTTRVS